ncbi:MAG: peptidoglycan editing factor PgeF [Ignavibacteriaceae bacterium]
MFIIQPYIFKQFPKIVSAISTRIGLNREAPYSFNLSVNVGDDLNNVLENRKAFFDRLGFNENEMVFQNQIHSDIISVVDSPGNCGESDSLITSQTNLMLVITIADCTPVLIYDAENHVIAAVHSGWRGAENQILKKTLLRMNHLFNSNGQNLYVYLGPSISQVNYEVGKEIAELFDKNFIINLKGKYFLDVASLNYHFLIDFGVKPNNIQKSVLCTYQMKDLLHSFRRDGDKSGRSVAVIAMRNS